MGFMKKGGTVKTHTMPDGTKMKGAKHGMKHGGAVKGKNVNGWHSCLVKLELNKGARIIYDGQKVNLKLKVDTNAKD
jgi:hypothetical protein